MNLMWEWLKTSDVEDNEKFSYKMFAYQLFYLHELYTKAKCLNDDKMRQ